MSKGLFQSPKKALLFVGATMLSVVVLIGPEGEEGALVQAADRLDQVNSSEFEPRPVTPRPIQSQSAPQLGGDTDWLSDDDLIDDTAGFDPTPIEADPADGDVYIIQDDF